MWLYCLEDYYSHYKFHLESVDIILVVANYLSKYGHSIMLKHPFTTPIFAEIFIHEVVRVHGIPHAIM